MTENFAAKGSDLGFHFFVTLLSSVINNTSDTFQKNIRGAAADETLAVTAITAHV
jgi:hypothetical protein